MKTTAELLTRTHFREDVFERDEHKCVVCGTPAKDAHHIIERRLWPDGGYFLDNGVSVCTPCHLKAESTEISCDQLREAAGIKTIYLPPHLYSDQAYDKWGNEILPNGTRLMGELFHDESVQKVLKPVLHLFTTRVKYPRTYHLPWSPGMNKDDRMWSSDTYKWFNDNEPEIVITAKMDGENTTMYSDYMHARSVEYESHPARHRTKAFHAQIAYEIPPGWRVCVENLYAFHNIHYQYLPAYEQMFSIWTDKNECLSWDETETWAKLIGIPLVPVLYRGKWSSWSMPHFRKGVTHLDGDECEGYVVRVAGQFHYREFRQKVGKYVRAGHIQNHGKKYDRVIPNVINSYEDHVTELVNETVRNK